MKLRWVCILTVILLLSPHFVCSQSEDTLQYPRSILKTNPLQFLAVGEIRALYEQSITNKWSLSGGGGYVYPGHFMYQSRPGDMLSIKGLLEVRRYKLFGNAEYFFSARLFFRYREMKGNANCYRHPLNLCILYALDPKEIIDYDSITRVYGLKILSGWQPIKLKGIVELYFGVGARYKHTYEYNRWGWDDDQNFAVKLKSQTQTTIKPTLHFGVNVGFNFATIN